MDLILLLILSLTSLSSFQNSVAANTSTKTPLTTTTILKTLTTTKPSTQTGSSILLDTISTTTPLPKPINSSKSTNETNVNKTTKSDETGEILNGQEQAQSPYIRGRGRQNGFQPGLGPNIAPNYNPNYGLPFNAFIPQGLPFSGSPGSSNNGLNNRPGLFNPRDQLNNNNNNNNNRQGQLTSPLDLLSGFIPTPGPGGPYTGTPTPFGQPVTGYPGYPNYPGLNPNYGPVNAPGLNNNGFGAARGTPNVYNQLGRPDVPETGLGAQGDNTDGQEGEDGVDQGVDGNSSNEDEGQEENGAENETGQPDYEGANDTEETGAQDDKGGEGETGAEGGEGGEGGDPANDPDLAQFQNFQGGNFPGDLFPPGILSQQDLSDIQKSIEEQQKKEAEKKRQEEESAAQPEYDYDDANGNKNEEETSTETPANVNSNYNQPINQPVVPNYQNRLANHQGLNNNRGAYANNNRVNPQFNNQYNNRLNPALISNQRKSNRQNIQNYPQNYPQNQFDDNVGYNNPVNSRPVAGNQDYDYNGSGESGINQGPARAKGDVNRINNYQNGAYSSAENNDYDNNNGNNDRYTNSRTQSYPRGSNFNRFNEDSGRYRPGSFGRSGYRGENLRDFGGHSADSYQQNDVEPGVDYSPDPVYDPKRLRKQDKPRRLSVPNNRLVNNGRNNNRFSGVKPSVDYDGETRNYPGSTRKPRLSPFIVNTPTPSIESSIHKPPISTNYNPFIANHKWNPRASEYDTSSVDYDEGENNASDIGYDNLPRRPLNYDSSKADYTDDVEEVKDDNNSEQLTNYRQTPRFIASEKKEDKRLANSQIKTIDPFLRG